MRVLFRVAVMGLWVAKLASAHVDPDDSLAPLARGSLEVWVPDTFFRGSLPQAPVTHQYQWSPLLSEFKADFPEFDLRFNILERPQFVQAIHSAATSPGPDIVFVDNQSERGPLMDSNALIEMLGPSRFYQSGSWLIFRQSKNFAAAEAFLVWLSQSPHWQPWQLATASMQEPDSAAAQSVSTEAVNDYLRADAQSLASLMDPQASRFYRLAGCESVEQVKPLLTFGDSRLAFVLTSTLCRREKAFGISHSALILRKVEDRWKVLLFVDEALPNLEAMLRRFDRIRLQDGPQETVPVIKPLTPTDHASLPRFPPGELQWEAADSQSPSYLVESQFSDPGLTNWSLSQTALFLPRNRGPLVSVQIPFGVGRQPHRWRVWAIVSTGDVSISDWRTIDFTN